MWTSLDLPLARAGAESGGDTRGVQLAGACKHAVGVCDDGDKAGGADDVNPFTSSQMSDI